jgi:hypothetical protein
VIKVLVYLTARIEKAKPVDMPTGTVCPIGPGVPDEDVAALSAAIFAAIGPHRILHLAQTQAMAGRAVAAPPIIHPIRRAPQAAAPDNRSTTCPDNSR